MGLRDVAAVLTGRREERSDSTADLLAGFVGEGGWLSNSSSVSYDQALTHGAVYACVDLLVRLVGWQMPAYVGDSLAQAGIVVDPHPEPQLSAEHWRSQALESVMMRGFAAGIVTSVGPNGWPRKISPLHPDSLTWFSRDGSWVWMVESSPERLWQEGGQLWVAPSLRVSPGRPVGRSVIGHAAAKIRLGLSASKFGRDYFDAQGQPVSHLQLTDQPNVAQGVAREVKDRFREAVKYREPLVTGAAWKLDTIPVTAEESQFLETISANVADVCMFFGVPPEAIGGSSGDSMTYANVEGRNLALLTNTVGAWMSWLETIYTSLVPGEQRVTLDPEALLRTSVPTLFDTAQKAVGRGNTPGVLTANEARAMVGYGPVPNGDDLYVPVNYSPAAVIEDVVTNGGGGGGQPAANP
jgi:HK97 family phage portal protein